VTITRIVQTCRSSPSQWEGYFADGRAFYIRYRYGRLEVSAHAQNPLADDAESLVDEDLGRGPIDGELSYVDLRSILQRHGIDAPAALEVDTPFHKGIVPALKI
jgi:hypothetical protein